MISSEIVAQREAPLRRLLDTLTKDFVKFDISAVSCRMAGSEKPFVPFEVHPPDRVRDAVFGDKLMSYNDYPSEQKAPRAFATCQKLVNPRWTCGVFDEEACRKAVTDFAKAVTRSYARADYAFNMTQPELLLQVAVSANTTCWSLDISAVLVGLERVRHDKISG